MLDAVYPAIFYAYSIGTKIFLEKNTSLDFSLNNFCFSVIKTIAQTHFSLVGSVWLLIKKPI